MTPLERLDPFLASPAHRDLSRALLAALFRQRMTTVVCGDAAARDVVAALVHSFAQQRVHLVFAQTRPLRVVNLVGDALETRELPAEMTVPQVLRSFLRQDPDVVVLDELDAEVGPFVANVAFTGHQVLVGSPLPFADVTAQLAGADVHLFEHLPSVLTLVVELRDGKLSRVLQRGADRSLVELARVEGEHVVLRRDLLPEEKSSAPLRTPHFAPPLTERPRPSRSPRAAFALHTTGHDTGSRNALGSRLALLRAGEAWPTCPQCQQPLALVARLDLATLPPELRPEPGLVQLFLCARGGCDVQDERAPGVMLERLDGALVAVSAPDDDSLGVVVVNGGDLGAPTRFDEDPLRDDDEVGPASCDKLGGWPAFQQGDETPLDPTGAPMELLLQLQEGAQLEGGREAGWSFTEGRVLPGEPPTRVVDPHAPCHLHSLLTGDATVFLFRGQGGSLALRWQTG